MSSDRLRDHYDFITTRHNPHSPFFDGAVLEAEPEPEPVIYCAGCGDTHVAHEGQVCLVCREFEPDNWFKRKDYDRMVEAAAKWDREHTGTIIPYAVALLDSALEVLATDAELRELARMSEEREIA